MSINSTFKNFNKKVNKSRRSTKSFSLNKRFISGTAAITPGISGLTQQSVQMQNKYSSILSNLGSQRSSLQNSVRQLPVGDYSLRNAGVDLAWKYEQGILELGGSGSKNWTPSQRADIINSGKVRGIHGHHINDVSNHPQMQGDPDNIRFLSRSEHFKAHGGDWRNSTSGARYNREALMKKELIKGEIGRFGIAILLGVGIGLALSAFESQLTFKERFSYGIEGAKIGGIAYTGGRIGDAILSSITGSQLSSTAKLAGIGVTASIATSIYVFYKVKRSGGSYKQAWKGAGINLAVSLSGFFITIIASSIWGGPAEVIYQS